MAEQLSRTAALAARLGELPAYWLNVHCSGCEAIAYLPCRLLAMQRGESLRLADVLPRLRCTQCRNAPASVALTDDATDGGLPSPYGQRKVPWRLLLMP